MNEVPDRLSPALEQVVTRYAEMVRGVGLQHGLSEADIDELLQDVRVRLWRAQADGDALTAVTASYVYRAAANAAIDLIRRRRRKRESFRDLRRVSQERLFAEEPPPHEGVEESELAERILQAVDTLAESRRLVVRMYLSGFTRSEIAEALDYGDGRTRNLLHRGLSDLRAKLREQGIGPELIE